MSKHQNSKHLSINKRLELIKEVGEEIVEEEELIELLRKENRPIAYDGFEPSGKIHIAQGILRTHNINKMIKAGFKFKILIADWFAFLNNKMGGDIDKIKTVGKYFIEVWEACGLKTDQVEFVWTSEIISDKKYWELVMKVAKMNTLNRIIRTSQIMGREEKEILEASQILYPCMQTADIFYLNAKVAQLGMDQRKVNMLAREIGEELGYWKPIVVSHHMLLGLNKPKVKGNKKMSKSDPDSAIFMTDSQEEIDRKIKKAFCPESVTENNPILEYSKYLLFEEFEGIKIKRPAKYGGNVLYNNYPELKSDYKNRNLHPEDLKNAVVTYLNKLIEPVRNHFEKNKEAKKLLDKVNSYRITK